MLLAIFQKNKVLCQKPAYVDNPSSGSIAMAKLILKQQEPPKGSWFTHYGSQVAYAGFIALLLLISLGILVAFKQNSNPIALQPLPSLNSAAALPAKAQYLKDWAKLNEMQTVYEQLATDTSAEDKATLLLNQAEMAWQHLLIMSEAISSLGLDVAEKKQLEQEQAYLQDQWQARIHFAELRLDRFNQIQQAQHAPESSTQVVTIKTDSLATPMVPEVTPTQPIADAQPTNKYIVQPPAGIELPAGFCTLNGANACKPEANQ